MQDSDKPAWWVRQYLNDFVLSEAEAWRIIESPPWRCSVAWVTKNAEPVCCVVAYVVLDGKIMMSSTTNRDKIKALRRNPAISLCVESKGFKQVTLRGRAEVSTDPKLVRRWTEAHLATWPKKPEGREYEQALAKYASPDRAVIIVHVDKMRTFDGEKMFQAEQGGRQ